MKNNKQDFFWPSYADLMTSLFFIMLVLYVLTYAVLNRTIKTQKKDLAKITAIDESLKPLKTNTTTFKYEKDYKRFQLAFNVKFEVDESQLMFLDSAQTTIQKIDDAGRQLKSIVDDLKRKKNTDSLLANVSYILIIAGYASDFGAVSRNYELSHERAISLWQHWKDIGINFEAPEYDGLIDLQIAGNGIGGVGRVQGSNEAANQRFLIQIFPKIGDLESK